MTYDFDAVIDRAETHSLKWDHCQREFGLRDVIPMWVADMDFPVPPPVVEAIRARAAHPVYGYVSTPDSFWQSAIDWLARRHGWQVRREWMERSPGVVPALSLCVEAFTQPGDRIVVQPPVYYPFFWAVEHNGRRLVRNPLILEDGRFRMDLDDLEAKLGADTCMLILCSPHNPVGRVWERRELERLGEVCERHDLVVLSDEIHMDLALPGHRHVPLATVSPALADRTITCLAPSKTFNIAGLTTALVVAANPALLRRYRARLSAAGIGLGSLFGTVALEAAYTHGGEWLDQLTAYLAGNVEFAARFARERLPGLRLLEPEGTYLALLDCRALGLAQPELDDFFLRRARVFFDGGTMFGTEGAGYERVNLGCPRATLAEALRRIERALAAREAGGGRRAAGGV